MSWTSISKSEHNRSFDVTLSISSLASRTGTVTMEEIMHKYDFAWHPEVRAGKKTVQDAAKEFMSQWDRDTKDAIISMEEFEDYYKDISASIDDDVYFELMIRNAWRITGGEGMAANTANRFTGFTLYYVCKRYFEPDSGAC